MKRDISKKKTLHHPIDRVWSFLTEPSQLNWLGDSELELKEGGSVKFTIQGKEFSGEILTVQEPINLAYSWNDPSHDFTSYVWWKLLEQKNSTLIELEHSGFKGVRGILSSYSYQGFWNKRLKMLQKALESASVEA